jgi:uncharacterized protein YjdB
VVVTNLTPTSVSVTVINSSMTAAQTQQASVTGNFAQVTNAPVTGAAVDWTSSNPGVLTVDSSGLITAVANGTAKVSATVGGVTGTSALITVGPQTIGFTRTGSSLTLNWQTGTLLQSTNVAGPWTTNNTAVSPYTIPMTNRMQFFRLLVSP